MLLTPNGYPLAIFCEVAHTWAVQIVSTQLDKEVEVYVLVLS
jgi:hypothetical protein